MVTIHRRGLSALGLAALLADDRPTCDREPPVVLLRWCPRCREYMREGSAALGRCLDCGTPRPATTARD